MYRCNYAGTLEGVLFNKMAIDTIFLLPFVPYWIKCILFFLMLMPLYALTFVDDYIGTFILYSRLSVHQDFFDFGIMFGKIFRLVFQLYLNSYMFYEYMGKHWLHEVEALFSGEDADEADDEYFK